ncbi:mycofactocin-coupled SDR family oxidoreductase [Pseudonocardia xishanensis]|uniref:Rv0687 family mycofactocin-dependent SDR oxidoreductase n=1 Tax=Pseudonocardia xishanensis TaxID=630995 RepID=A0ABP8RUJ4_9PSEU
MSLLGGRVAVVTGAARGQGRAHCVRLAREGAAIIALDVCERVSTRAAYPPATSEDLDTTAALVEAEGQRVCANVVDVRSSRLDAVVAEGVALLGGRLDVVVANAGISDWNRFWEMSDEQWQTMIDINLTGVWRTLRATVPHMIAAGNGGSVITVSSVAGLKSLPGQAHYSAAKHGVVGLTKTAAIELGEYGIRVNSLHPWGVATPMGEGSGMRAVLDAHPSYAAAFASLLPKVSIAEVDDIADSVVFLASDLSRTMTGAQLTVDMGATKI